VCVCVCVTFILKWANESSKQLLEYMCNNTRQSVQATLGFQALHNPSELESANQIKVLNPKTTSSKINPVKSLHGLIFLCFFSNVYAHILFKKLFLFNTILYLYVLISNIAMYRDHKNKTTMQNIMCFSTCVLFSIIIFV